MKSNILEKYPLILIIITLSTVTTFCGPKPNILFILLDDMGYADVGFMPEAAKDIYTPNIDALAEQGMVFTSSHVSHPFCGPSRTSIMTGRMPHPIGAQFNLAAFSGFGIDTSETYFSKVLNDADYYTGLIGKWHLGEEEIFHPNNRGFDYFYGFLGGGHEYFSDSWLNAGSYNPNNFTVGNYAGEYMSPMMENMDYVETENGQYCTDLLTDAGLTFIEEASNDDDPFFLFMSYNAPHTPVQALSSDIDAIKNELGTNAAPDGTERLTYTAMMYNVDYNIERLVEKLKNTGEYENTLIVFLSDNGGRTNKGASNAPLRAGKGSTYEGGFRVPMFIHWPNGGVPQGSVNPYNFSSLDFYPTFIHLGGAELPEGKKLDGINVWEHILNNSDPRKDSCIFAMRPHNGNNQTGVVRNNFKLYTGGNGFWNLYDLSKDIGENTNIASQYPDVVDSMKLAVYEWTWTHIRPKFFDNPSYGFEDSWNNTNMPNWGKTFGSLYDPNDYVTGIEPGITVTNYASAYVYPNPVHSKVVIVFDSEDFPFTDAGLYDMAGRIVQKEFKLLRNSQYEYEFEIDPNVPNGNFYLKINTGKESIARPVVITR